MSNKEDCNCFECEWSRTLAGSTHLSCYHPFVVQNPLTANFFMRIDANQHGIDNGWFLFPFDFDPTWLNSCVGFLEKGTEVLPEINDINRSIVRRLGLKSDDVVDKYINIILKVQNKEENFYLNLMFGFKTLIEQNLQGEI
jgi:hypothetical protein